jgi:hypothetical protein
MKFKKQFTKCTQDGTAKKMTPELKALMPARDQALADSIGLFRGSEPRLYKSGVRFCGKKAGVCSSAHCKGIE